MVVFFNIIEIKMGEIMENEKLVEAVPSFENLRNSFNYC